MDAFPVARGLCLTALCYGAFMVLVALSEGDADSILPAVFVYLVAPSAGLVAAADFQRTGWLRLAVAVLLATSVPGLLVALGLTLFLIVGLSRLPDLVVWFLGDMTPWVGLVWLAVPAGVLLLGIALLRGGRRKTGVAVLRILAVAVHIALGGIAGGFMFRGVP